MCFGRIPVIAGITRRTRMRMTNPSRGRLSSSQNETSEISLQTGEIWSGRSREGGLKDTMGGTGYDKKSGKNGDGRRVTERDFRFSGGIGAKTGRYLARACPRLPAEPVDARGSRWGPGARDDGIVQQPRYVRPARKTEQRSVDRPRSGHRLVMERGRD